MTRSSIIVLAVLPLVSFVLGTQSMELPVLVLFGGIVVLLPRADRDIKRRMHASLLVGTSLAWVLLPHSVFDFREQRLSPIATDIPGCQVMARAGFPIQQVSAHGGGGWRLGHHLPGDCLAHASNCLLLAVVIWVAMRLVPCRLWWHVHLVAWLTFVPLCYYGLSSMVRWWD